MYDKDGVDTDLSPEEKEKLLAEDKRFYENLVDRCRMRLLTSGSVIDYADERGQVEQVIEVLDDGYRFYFRYARGRPNNLREYQLTLWAEYKHSDVGCPQLVDAIMVPDSIKTVPLIG
jgi:hypothetical protein